LTAEIKYGGTVTNVKRVTGGGSSYSKTTRTEVCADMWDSQQTSLTNEVYGCFCAGVVSRQPVRIAYVIGLTCVV